MSRPFPEALKHLREVKGWLCWKLVPKKGDPSKTTKEPRNARAPKFRASNRKPSHWDTFKVARHSWKTYQEFADGVGFVVDASPVEVWIDIDECRNPETGSLTDGAQRLVDMCASYVEITPSGRGIRIIGTLSNGLSAKPIHKAYRMADGTHGEIFYRATRYVTVTGNQLEGSANKLGDVTAVVETILKEAVSKKDGVGLVRDDDDISAEEEDDLISEIQEKGPLGLSEEQIKQYLEQLPPWDAVDELGAPIWNYELFMETVFAVHHETSGSEEGWALLDEWAAGTPHYNEEGLREKWNSPRGDVAGLPTISFKTIIKRANDHTRPMREEKLDSLIGQIARAMNRQELEDAKIAAQRLQIDTSTGRAMLSAQFRLAFKRITGVALSESTAKRELTYRDPNLGVMPRWLKPFAWITEQKKFYNSANGQSYDPETFDLTFGIKFMTREEIAQGEVKPALRPTDAALNRFQVPTAHALGYKPYKGSEGDEADDDSLDDDDAEDDNGAEKRAGRTEDVSTKVRRPRFYAVDSVRYLNRFHMRNACPAKVGALTKRERRDVEQIRALYWRLTGSQRDRDLLLSYIRHIIVERTRIPWAIMLIGAERSGKTTAVNVMMRLLLGDNNVGIYGPQVLMDKTDQSWRDGHLLKVIEEVWLPEYSKAVVVERIKEVITNDVVSARFMYVGERRVVNTASYIGLTNHQDVLALSAKDTRFYPIMSPLTATRVAMDKLLEDDPTFYIRVREAMGRSLPAFRQWLEHEFTPHADFNASSARAPSSATKERLIEETRDPLDADILAMLDRATHPLVCRDVVSLRMLHGALLDANVEIGGERGKRQSEVIAQALRRLDYRARGMFRVRCITDEHEELMSGNAGDNRTRIYTSGAGPLDSGKLDAARLNAWVDSGGL